MTKTCSAVGVSLLLVTLLGCGSSTSTVDQPVVGQDIISAHTLHVVGRPTTTATTLPQQLAGPEWGLTEGLCQQAGYDLAPYAGQTVDLVRYPVGESYYLEVADHFVEPLDLWVIAKGQTSICGYLTVRQGSSMAPGIFAVNDANVR